MKAQLPLLFGRFWEYFVLLKRYILCLPETIFVLKYIYKVNLKKGAIIIVNEHV